MNLAEILQTVSPIEGWFYDDQMTVLHPIIAALPDNAVLVEVGTYYGRATLFFRLSNRKIEIVTIDLCKPYETVAGVHVDPPLAMDERVLKHGKIRQIIGDSSEAASRFQSEVDCLFVDGNHTYDGVRKDIVAWMPKMRTGGVVIFHDYDPQYEGVIRAVDELENGGTVKRLRVENLVYVGTAT